MTTIQEGDRILIKATAYRVNDEQTLVEIQSMQGPYSLRVPLSSVEDLDGDIERRFHVLYDGEDDGVWYDHREGADAHIDDLREDMTPEGLESLYEPITIEERTRTVTKWGAA